jgi:hypothetical protein
MRVEYPQYYWYAKEPFLCGRVLCALVNLFPERQIVVSTAVQVIFKWDTGHPMEHEIRELAPVKVSEHLNSIGRTQHTAR